MQMFSTLGALAALAMLATPLAIAHPAKAMELQSQTSRNLCVDLNQSNGQIALWTCNAGPNQDFFTGQYGQQRFNGQCLDQAGTSGSNMWLMFRACDINSRTQRWGLSPQGELKNESGYCLDVPYGNFQQGQRLQMFSCNNGSNQRFGVARAAAAVPVGLPVQPRPAQPGTSANGAPLISLTKYPNGVAPPAR